MTLQTVLKTVEETLHTVHLGLWVLWTEARWLAGPDMTYQRRLKLMRHQRDAYQTELSRMATLADPRRENVAADLSLLEQDLSRLEADRGAHRQRLLAGLQSRFANVL